MTGLRFLWEHISHHAKTRQERDAVVIARHGRDDGRISYLHLDRAARAVADWLARQGVAEGARVLLLFPTGLDFVKAFLGCLYAGAVPVPAPLPGGQPSHLTRTAGIVKDAQVAAVLTDEDNLPEIAAWLRDDGFDTVLGASVRTAEEQGDGTSWQRPETRPEDLAFLQYTSGSTGNPKGVMVTHQALSHNLGLMRLRFDPDQKVNWCGWVPMYHDMGLIALLLFPLQQGVTTTLMAPMAFLKRPYMWLEAIAKQDAAASAAPSFAYDLCARRLTDEQVARLDLSRWRLAINGAEPIDPNVLERFTKRFSAAGFRSKAFMPAYGMAESTLHVSSKQLGQGPLVLQADSAALELNVLRPVSPGKPGLPMVSSGTVEDLDVRIVDPHTGCVLADGSVGEIWIHGESVAKGYWANEQKTNETFHAVPTGGDGRRYLRSGDLGAYLDGQLYVTGRIKDVIIIRGRNLHPQDIERETRTVHPSLADLATSAFSVPVPHEEIVIVQEVRPSRLGSTTLPELVERIRTEIGEQVGARIAGVVLVRPGMVEKTTSGKIRRSLMRERFRAGALESLYEMVEDTVRARARPGQAASSQA